MEVLKLKLLLCCTTADPLSEHVRENIYLHESLECTKVNDVKFIIQREFNIPACVQLIKWEGTTLGDGRTLDSYGLMENDELHVLYHSKGDCKTVEESIEWLKQVLSDLTRKGVPNRISFTEYLHPLLSFDQQETHLRTLWAELFQPWHNPVKYTNKLYFMVLNGLDMMVELFKLVLTNHWSNSPGALKYTEFLLLHAFWSFGETFSLQRLTMRKGAMDLFLKSLERVKVSDSKETQSWFGSSTTDLSDIADGALGVLSNFCELHEGQQFLANKPDTLNLLLTIMTSDEFSPPVNVSVAEVMMQVSNEITSHSFLSQEDVVQILIDNPYYAKSVTLDAKYECLSRYFAMQCLGRVLLVSPHSLSWLPNQPIAYKNALQTITALLLEETLSDIVQYEDEAGYLWYTLIPEVAVLYRPMINKASELYELQVAARTLFVSTLTVILRRKGHTSVLVNEGLLDFVICLPWCSEGEVRKRAGELVGSLRWVADIDYQPPSLVNMCKAAVAVHYCGLETVMSLSVPELACKIFHMKS